MKRTTFLSPSDEIENIIGPKLMGFVGRSVLTAILLAGCVRRGTRYITGYAIEVHLLTHRIKRVFF